MADGKSWVLVADYGGAEDVIARWKEKPSDQDVNLAIRKWSEERNWNIPYFRIWTEEDGATWYDVGSWSTLLVFKEEEV